MGKKIMSSIEDCFISMYQEYDDFGGNDHVFYDVVLLPEVFGEDFINEHKGKQINMGLYLSSCKVEIFADDEIVLLKYFKVIL